MKRAVSESVETMETVSGSIKDGHSYATIILDVSMIGEYGARL